MCDDLPRVERTTSPTAKKDHACVECDVGISKGETYEHVRGLWEGEWRTYRTCKRCVEMRRGAGLLCYTYGDLYTTVMEGEP